VTRASVPAGRRREPSRGLTNQANPISPALSRNSRPQPAPRPPRPGRGCGGGHAVAAAKPGDRAAGQLILQFPAGFTVVQHRAPGIVPEPVAERQRSRHTLRAQPRALGELDGHRLGEQHPDELAAPSSLAVAGPGRRRPVPRPAVPGRRARARSGRPATGRR